MSDNPDNLISMWRSTLSAQLKEPNPLELSEEFKQMAAMFSPGHYYFFVVNLYSMEFEYVHPSIESMLGVSSLNLNLSDLIRRLHPEDEKQAFSKECLFNDFVLNFLEPEQVQHYKALSMLRLRDDNEVYRQILQQVTILKTTEDGKPEYMMGVHADVSFFNMPFVNTVSFISLKTGLPSYFNITPDSRTFSPDASRAREMRLLDILSDREREIIRWLSQGFNAEQIGKRLNISYNTIRTHRKNMLMKSGCKNTTELVAQCLMEGLI